MIVELEAKLIEGPRTAKGRASIIYFWFKGRVFITGLLICRDDSGGFSMSQSFDVRDEAAALI